jgi:hypothetical protein
MKFTHQQAGRKQNTYFSSQYYYFKNKKIGKMPHKAELERTKQELAQALAEIDKIGKDNVSRDLLPLFLLYCKLILFPLCKSLDLWSKFRIHGDIWILVQNL